MFLDVTKRSHKFRIKGLLYVAGVLQGELFLHKSFLTSWNLGYVHQSLIYSNILS